MGNRKARRVPGPQELAVRKQMQADSICGCLTARGDVCMRSPGWGTDHPGTGSCKNHESFVHVTKRKPGERYRKGLAGNALEFFLEMANDPEVKRLDDEIAVLRASLNECNLMIQDIRDRAEVLNAFAGMQNATTIPGQWLPPAGDSKRDPVGNEDRKALLQLNRDRARIAEAVSKLVVQKHHIEEGKIVTFRQVQEVLAQVIYVVTRHVTDEKLRQAIAEDFARIDISKLEP